MSRVLQEGQHPGEFIVSLANHTRSQEEGLLPAGTEIVDGTPINIVGGEIVAATAAAVGIIIGSYTLSTDDDAVRVAYVARDAEVKDALINWPDSGAATVKTNLEALGIIFR